jgi:hypothetical protein
MRRLLCLPLVALGLALLPGEARPRTEIKHPDGPLPKALLTNPASDVPDEPLRVWLAYEGYRPHVLPDTSSARVKLAKPLKFMQSFHVASTRNEQNFHLLVTSANGKDVTDYVGWVPGRYLVRSKSAELDPDTGLTRKVLVVNTRESLGTDLKEVRIRHAPLASAEGRDEPQRLYTTMFVFGEADGFVLVGDSSGFRTRDDRYAAEAVMGWLPRNRVAIWNTREALEWDHESTLEPKDRPHYLKGVDRPTRPKRRTARGQIYETVEKAKKALEDPSVPGIFVEDAFKEDAELKLGYPISPRLAPKAPRFPVLRRLEKERDAVAGDLFEVGGIGGLYDGKGNLVLSAAGVVQLKDALDSVRSQSAQTDILFVIDDTESMDKWFPVVARTVRRVTDLARENKRKVRVAYTFYNDTNGGGDPKKVIKTSPLKDVARSGEAIAKEVATHKRGKGGDPHEMVFRGILEGVQKAGFSPKARKLVVVIGDCGDITGKHANPDRLRADPEYAKKYNVKAIVEALVPDNLGPKTAIEFYAIQVIDPSKSEAAGDFKTQMQEIAELHTERLRALRKKLSPDFDEKKLRPLAGYFDPKENRGTSVETVLAGRYTRLLQEEKDLEGQIERLKKGQWLTTGLTPEMERLIDLELKRRGVKVSLSELRHSGGLQLFQTGFVWEKTRDGLPQVRRRVFLNGGELEELVSFLSKLDTKEGENLPLYALLAGVIERQANDRDIKDPERRKKLALKDVLKKSMGLAFRNSLMNKSLGSLRAGKGFLQDGEYHALLHSRDLLKDVFDGKACDYAVTKVERAGQQFRKYARAGKARDEPRSFHIGKDQAVKWYYLDYMREWP